MKETIRSWSVLTEQNDILKNYNLKMSDKYRIFLATDGS
jgi:hypothetical protein